MAPVKFDDIPKVANEVINDDYQVSGHVLKAKQKTAWGGAVLSTQVDLFQKDCATPAKLTWRLPKPLGIGHFDIDKLEMDKGGKLKLEASSTKAYPGLKLECKSDLADVSKVVACCTYTGMKDVQLKLECKALKPQDFNGEATYQSGPVTCGLKFTPALLGGGLPDFGVRFLSGPMFCSVLAKEQFGKFSAAAHYKVNDDLRCAAVCDYSKKGPNVTMGCTYMNLYKMKVSQDQSVCCSAKYVVSKGFTLLGGAKYNVPEGKLTYGLQLSIE